MKSGRHVEVFDPEFKYVKEVPSTVVRHLPPARLNITRLVFCRNYVPGELGSCSMGDGCKFVHADVDPDSLESHPIHVKYAWRHEDVCTYARLPAGETLRVLSLSDRAVLEEFASERVLVTRGSLRYRTEGATLSQCVHYNQHRMCNRGERCNFVHTVFVDPNVKGNFKRAPIHVQGTALQHRLSTGGNSLCSSVLTAPHALVLVESAAGCHARRALHEDTATLHKATLHTTAWYHHNPYAPMKRFRTYLSPSSGADGTCSTELHV